MLLLKNNTGIRLVNSQLMSNISFRRNRHIPEMFLGLQRQFLIGTFLPFIESFLNSTGKVLWTMDNFVYYLLTTALFLIIFTTDGIILLTLFN